MGRSRIWRLPWLVILALATLGGCAKGRQYHQREADGEVYSAIAERNGDARWHAPDIDIRMDPTSRFYEPYNENCPPMPEDDPTSHAYLHCVDGKRGWKHWHDYGTRASLENPGWRETLYRYGPVDEDRNIVLDVDSAVRLAYVHSPLHQQQLETLYLSALDVTEERFRLDTQFFGGLDTIYVHDGKVVPASIQYDGLADRYVVSPPFEGIESNRLSVGTSGSPFEARRQFATAGQLLAGFANSFVVEFTGDDVGLANSLANFTFIQPLLRGAGRDIALEQLTFTERNLLANLRAYSQFRQGFYTLVAVGDLGVAGPVRNSRSTNLSVFSGQGGVDGYVGLLQRQQQIRNAEDNLKLQSRSLQRLEAFLATGVIDLVQVEQFRQNLENERANLLQARNDYLRTFDNYKRNTLGLPPDVPLSLDDTLIEQFRLVANEGTQLQDIIANLQAEMGAVGEDITREQLQVFVSDIQEITQSLVTLIESAKLDVAGLEGKLAARRETLTGEALELLDEDLVQLQGDAAKLDVEFEQLQNVLMVLSDEIDNGAEEAETIVEPPPETELSATGTRRTVVGSLRDRTTDLLAALKGLTQDAILAQARARLESVAVEPIKLSPEKAFDVALSNRLDFMNGRAALVDSWRLIAVSADALQSVLNITSSGNVRTNRNNPLSFHAATSNLRLGLEFDAPFTRLLERNAYRQALINYQRSRRALIQSRDALQVDLRVLLRQIDQLEENLEIQRRSVAIAIRRVDLTQARLEAPTRPAQPGQRPPQLGPTAAINLISAQAALRDTQNSLLRVWLSYFAARMRLARELGIMSLDPDGLWVEQPLPTEIEGESDDGADSSADAAEEVLAIPAYGDQSSLPPELPSGIVRFVESLPENFEFPVSDIEAPRP